MDVRPGDETSSEGEEEESNPPTPNRSTAASSSAKVHKSEREKRTYRACLHCRQRKSRCDLYSSGEPGRPPCERCIREQHECILGGSRRGGRRVKRTTSGAITTPSTSRETPNADQSISNPGPYYGQQAADPHGYQATGQRLPSWHTLNPDSRNLPPHSNEGQPPEAAKMRVDDSVASTDLQNPADALEFLAHVAERNSDSNQLPPMNTAIFGRSPTQGAPLQPSRPGLSTMSSMTIDYPPLTRGDITLQMVHVLLDRYQEKYHPFFPLANPATMDPSNLPTSARDEKHLLAAILTVASKDDKEWQGVHDICSAQTQSLVASLVYSGSGSVEAVEAMLILAEWVPRRPYSTTTPGIGRGEEDQAAWMYVGIAIRLGYLLGIDRTGFREQRESPTADLNRKRLAWANCYMSDRQISVRIGKAFWSRGPGPMTSLDARDFPSLRSMKDDFPAIFEANLALTQLFSNAHDVLYATKSRSNQLNAGGEYVKYIDDFRVSLRHWNDKWGHMTCSDPLKASLILSYEYLRLYVNAFAYQATLSRLLSQLQQSGSSNASQARSNLPGFSHDVAYAPDARFIYDSVDAARTLLTTYCSMVSPEETFRFMPLRYYLYVIYSTVFLYKARSTGIMGPSDRAAVRDLIPKTIESLQRSSACPNDVGERYAKLIRLLWSRRPGRGGSIAEPLEISRAVAAITGQASAAGSGDSSTRQPPTNTTTTNTNTTATSVTQFPNHMVETAPPSINTFSWLDLEGVGNFALENGSLMNDLDRFDDSSADGFSQSQFDMYVPQPYQMNDWSPSGIIF